MDDESSAFGTRKPGDRIPGVLVKDLRQKHGLTQEQLAYQLGVRGGKSVISSWENEHAPCEGPAAELMLRLFAETNATVDIATLTQEMDAIWRRVPQHSLPSWRQVTVVPEVPLNLDRSKFVALFPDAALTHDEYHHGFPFVGHGLPATVYGLNPAGWWEGVIPMDRNQAPHYLWLFKRDGRFAYREKSWEDVRSATTGHIDISSMLALTLATSFFMQKVAHLFALRAESKYTMQVDFEGATGRGIVELKYMSGHPILLDHPPLVSSASRVAGATAFTVSELNADPVRVGFAPVGELAAMMNPVLATDKALSRIVRGRFKHDGHIPSFGYLKNHEIVNEPVEPKRRR